MKLTLVDDGTDVRGYSLCELVQTVGSCPEISSCLCPQAVDITSCGNFAVIGLSCGRVDVYNLQSGQHRGCYGNEEKGAFSCSHLPLSMLCLCLSLTPPPPSPPSAAAHSGAVRGVATDALNQLMLTAGSDWLLKFWRFKSRKQEEQLKLHSAPASMMLHKDR